MTHRDDHGVATSHITGHDDHHAHDEHPAPDPDTGHRGMKVTAATAAMAVITWGNSASCSGST